MDPWSSAMGRAVVAFYPGQESSCSPTSAATADHSIARKIGKARFHNLRDAMRAVDALVDSLRQVTPRLTGIGARSDCMLAVYPGEGARFQRHVDNTAKDGRVLTAVLYLSGGAWDRAHGGQLRVFPRPGEASEGHGGLRRRPVDVFPDAGRLVLFYSDEIPHEVLPTHTHRYACTVWYYDKEEREAAVARAKEAGIGVGAEEGKAAHKEATEFVRGMVSTEGIASEELASRAEALSAGENRDGRYPCRADRREARLETAQVQAWMDQARISRGRISNEVHEIPKNVPFRPSMTLPHDLCILACSCVTETPVANVCVTAVTS